MSMVYTRKEIKSDLRNLLKEFRYEHTLGVEYTAACLAMRYGADVKKADMAGLLHDCAKYMTGQEMLRYARDRQLPVSSWEEQNPELLHARLGAFFAREKYGVEDEEILSAITWHTTGKPGMSLLDKILFIADYIEPNRDKASHLEEIRRLAFSDIDQCLIRVLSDTVAYLAACDHVTDPMTRETLSFYQNLQKR